MANAQELSYSKEQKNTVFSLLYYFNWNPRGKSENQFATIHLYLLLFLSSNMGVKEKKKSRQRESIWFHVGGLIKQSQS